MPKFVILLSCVFASVGCAATVPTEKLAASAAAIRSAEELGAQQNPKAALYLQLAKEQSSAAEKIISSDGDIDEASSLLVRAAVDAELARALARSYTTGAQAQQAIDRVTTLNKSNQ